MNLRCLQANNDNKNVLGVIFMLAHPVITSAGLGELK